MRSFSRNTLLALLALFLAPTPPPTTTTPTIKWNIHIGIQLVRVLGLDYKLDRKYNDRSGEETKVMKICQDGLNTGENRFFENSLTLEDVWSNLKLLVPNRGTNGYIKPKAKTIADFERIVLDMLMVGHRCSRGDEKYHCRDDYSLGFQSRLSLPLSQCDNIDLRSLKGKYRVGSFVDRENGRSYCILATTSILYSWGNVIVDIDASSTTKNLSFDCPHPKFDAETGEQGIRMLKGTTARSWIVSGSHRMANNHTFGTCQPQYSHYPSDAAHSVDNCFLAAVAAIKYYYESVIHEDYTSVQLHGMGKATCGSIDTFFSYGSCSHTNTFDNQTEGKPNTYSFGAGANAEKIDILQTLARTHPHDNGRHAVAGRDEGNEGCKLCGSTNVQGRLINGVARKDLCDTFASSYNGRFIQIEQKRDYRRESSAKFWNDVFNEAYSLFSSDTTL